MEYEFMNGYMKFVVYKYIFVGLPSNLTINLDQLILK